MHYYNLKIKSNNGEYSLNSTDKFIIQREMDIYFSLMYGASKEFTDKIKKIERKNVEVKSIDSLEKNIESSAPPKSAPSYTQPNKNLNTYDTELKTDNDEFVQLSDPDIETEETKKSSELGGLVFKPVPKEELVFQEDVQSSPAIQHQTPNIEAQAPVQQQPAPIANPLPEIVSIKPQQNNSLEFQTENKDSQELKIIGIDEPKVDTKKEKQENLNKTIELVQNAINDIDIASDETFDIDIPDSYSNPPKSDNVELKEFDEEFDEEFDVDLDKYNSTQSQQNNAAFGNGYKNSDAEFIIPDKQEELPIAQNNSDFQEMGSIFSNENPFDNPPESQNIIAAKEYPEAKQALNLDFKTFLSNYNAKGIIDEFLICAYYIKHISGQHSFNMKYINSKIFQATGNIADSSVINGLITGNFIKVIEVDGQKKYSISSTGEEYFMTHYQR